MSERFIVHDDQKSVCQSVEMQWEGSPNNGAIDITKVEWAGMIFDKIHGQFGLSTTDFFEKLARNELNDHEDLPEILDLLSLRSNAQADLAKIELQVSDTKT